MMAMQFPPPQNWQDFEWLCREILSREWGAPAQRHGRTGQRQQGVDLFAQVGQEIVVAQCKLKTTWRGGQVTADELRAEVSAARKFDRRVGRFTLVTTAQRDVRIQAVARELSGAAPHGFAVDMLFWEDLEDRLPEHADLVAALWGWCTPDAAAAAHIRDYLQSLRERLTPLPIAAIAHANENAPTLETVYTAVDVLHEIGQRDVALERQLYAGTKQDPVLLADEPDYTRALRESLKSRGREHEPERNPARRVRAVEFLAANQHTVLLGPPGSGKSAFGHFVAICLANQRLSGDAKGLAQLAPALPGEAWTPHDTWPHGALLPLVVELRAFVADQETFPNRDSTIDAGHLLRHLASHNARCRLRDAMLPIVRHELAAGRGRGVLLILDGLDETPNASAVRVRLKRVIHTFCNEYPHARVLVTSRPYAYTSDADWQLPGFVVDSLAPLSPAAIEHFVRAWYSGLSQSGVLGSTDTDNRATQLLARLRRDAALRPFRERPLMLTLLTSLHASGRMSDGGRAAVYGNSVELLFDRWNEVVHNDNTDYFTAQFRMERSQVLDALARVAHRVHAEQGRGEAGAAPIPFAILWEEFGKSRPRDVGTDERAMLEYLDQRAGILLAEGRQVFRFPHRSFQEFLAARHLKADDDYPQLLVAAVRSDPILWREVLAHVVLMHAQDNSLQSVWTLLEELLPDESSVENPTTARIAIALAVAFAESARLRERAKNAPGATARRIARLRGLLVDCLEQGRLSAKDRVEAGDALGQLGDPRIGHRPENFLPWEPGGREGLGKYLVTVQEFAEFVDAGGYRDVGLWEPDGGAQTLAESRWTSPDAWAVQLEHPNRPVTGVSWFEAAAYCRWRSAVTGTVVRLPSSEEWQAAVLASGTTWPWGEDEPTDEHANYAMNVGHASAVGCYPAGAGRLGHLDLAGNVIEWTHDGRRTKGERVRKPLWGGAWHNDADDLRSWLHHVSVGVSVAGSRDDGVGFRVVAPASR